MDLEAIEQVQKQGGSTTIIGDNDCDELLWRFAHPYALIIYLFIIICLIIF